MQVLCHLAQENIGGRAKIKACPKEEKRQQWEWEIKGSLSDKNISNSGHCQRHHGANILEDKE